MIDHRGHSSTYDWYMASISLSEWLCKWTRCLFKRTQEIVTRCQVCVDNCTRHNCRWLTSIEYSLYSIISWYWSGIVADLSAPWPLRQSLCWSQKFQNIAHSNTNQEQTGSIDSDRQTVGVQIDRCAPFKVSEEIIPQVLDHLSIFDSKDRDSKQRTNSLSNP